MMLARRTGKNVAYYRHERPQHQVRITRPFWLGKYEVTQEQWQAAMGSNPSKFRGPQNPVEQLSWSDCQQFLSRLRDRVPDKAFRLPTEAEWEYACRCGAATQFWFGDDDKRLGDYAWTRENSARKSHPVGTRKPNVRGLHDMLGNVWEWCQDCYGPYEAGKQADPAGPTTGTYRVLRGGSWGSDADACRSAFRLYYTPGLRFTFVGFRVARPLP